MVFLAEFTKSVGAQSLELGEVEYGLNCNFVLSDDEMAMQLTFRIQDHNSD